MPTPESTVHRIVAATDMACERLDVFLTQQYPAIGTRSHAQRLIREGMIVVNDVPRKASQPVHPADIVTITIPGTPAGPQAEDFPLSVVYEDSDVAVIDKPAGLVVHPAPGHSEHTMVNALLSRYPHMDCGDAVRPGIVHRLDKDTSGLMVVALRTEARDWLISQFKSGMIHKVYLALLVGRTDASGCIEGAIGRHPVNRKRMALTPTGKPARTTYSVLERIGDYTLVEARPVTGRTHQLRVHFASIGHPIAGDRTYGGRAASRALDPVLQRQFLHATSLTLRLPHSDAETQFTAPLPADLQQALAAARRIAEQQPCPPSSDMV